MRVLQLQRFACLTVSERRYCVAFCGKWWRIQCGPVLCEVWGWPERKKPGKMTGFQHKSVVHVSTCRHSNYERGHYSVHSLYAWKCIWIFCQPSSCILLYHLKCLSSAHSMYIMLHCSLQSGATALHLAANAGQEACVKELLQCGADLTATDLVG